jgi:hypothetical protein
VTDHVKTNIMHKISRRMEAMAVRKYLTEKNREFLIAFIKLTL